MEDNADFQKYLNKNSGGAQISDTINTQNLYTILTSLLANPRLSSSLFHQAPKSGPQFRQGGPMNQHQRAQGRIPMPHANHMQNPMQMMQQQQQFMQQHPQQQQQQQQQMHMQMNMMQQQHPQQFNMTPQQQQQMAAQQQMKQGGQPQQQPAPVDETVRAYQAQAQRLIPSIVPEN